MRRGGEEGRKWRQGGGEEARCARMRVCGEMRYSLGVGAAGRRGGGGAGAADLGSELDADEAEHEGHGLLEVDEVGDGDREELVEAAQPDDGGDVGGVHDEGVAGHAEDGGDRVDGEEHLSGWGWGHGLGVGVGVKGLGLGLGWGWGVGLG